MPVFDAQSEACAQRSAAGETREEAARQVAFAEVAAQEREVLAQTLHDTLCQSLTGLQFLARLVQERATRECPAMTGDVGELKEMIHKMSEELHELVHSLRSPPNIQAGA